ncbi:MAG: hypothetical protein AAFQ90_10495 [Pseudomonadota bacterium]
MTSVFNAALPQRNRIAGPRDAIQSGAGARRCIFMGTQADVRADARADAGADARTQSFPETSAGSRV